MTSTYSSSTTSTLPYNLPPSPSEKKKPLFDADEWIAITLVGLVLIGLFIMVLAFFGLFDEPTPPPTFVTPTIAT